MEVVAFVGPSGTGKSHRAIGVAFDNKCDAIIDDGLLIKGTRILAGTSAKNEGNRIQAVKRAICQGQKAVCSLRRIVRFEGQTDLHHRKAHDNHTDRADQTEHEV